MESPSMKSTTPRTSTVGGYKDFIEPELEDPEEGDTTTARVEYDISEEKAGLISELMKLKELMELKELNFEGVSPEDIDNVIEEKKWLEGYRLVNSHGTLESKKNVEAELIDAKQNEETMKERCVDMKGLWETKEIAGEWGSNAQMFLMWCVLDGLRNDIPGVDNDLRRRLYKRHNFHRSWRAIAQEKILGMTGDDDFKDRFKAILARTTRESAANDTFSFFGNGKSKSKQEMIGLIKDGLKKL